MNNKFQLENALTLTKSIAMLYVNATIESSNKKVNEVMDNWSKSITKNATRAISDDERR